MQTQDSGTYLEVEGRPAVRFVRRYAYDVQRVWQAITDPAELKHWFPSPEVRYEPRAGGSMQLSGDPYGEGTTGTVLRFDPPHRFSFEWGEDELHFTLSPTDEGCELELLDVLAGSGAGARNAAGWEVCLEELRKAVEGTPGSGAHGDDTLDFRPLLDRYRAQGVPDDGWLPDDLSRSGR